MAAQRRQEFRGIDADHEPDLRARPGARRDRVDGIVGVAGAHGENFEAAPGEHLFGERQARARPSRDRSRARQARRAPRSRRARARPRRECGRGRIPGPGSARSGRRWSRARARVAPRDWRAGRPNCRNAGRPRGRRSTDRSDRRRGSRERSSAARRTAAVRRRRSRRRRGTASRFSAHSSRKPPEPISSPISISHLALKPSAPRAASTAPSAARLMVCWPLLSAVPRPQ